MTQPPVITLLTDFGVEDTYVGQMKGVIAGIARSATVIDLTHAIGPQNILQGAIVWADAMSAFPAGTIHVGVVDPGVGTSRRAIAAEIGAWRFVAPDNGLLTAIRQRWPTQAVIELDRKEWHRKSPSATFHGRDVFAPVAAHWASGVSMLDLGSAYSGSLVELALPEVQRSARQVQGQIQWADRFGNLATNIHRTELPGDVPALQFEVCVADHMCSGIARCYGDHPPGGLIALWNSSDRLEFAVNGGSAVAILGNVWGTDVVVRW